MNKSVGGSGSNSPQFSPRTSQEMPRTPLSQRLANLLPSRPASPAAAARSAAATFPSLAGTSTGSTSRDADRSDTQTQAVTRGRTQMDYAPPPHLRRTGKEVAADFDDRTESRDVLTELSKSDSKTAEALHEALSDDQFDYSKRSHIHITEPPRARLTSMASIPSYAAMQSGQGLNHPALLDNLGRSTFPSLALADAEPQPVISPRRVISAATSSFPFLGRSESPSRTSVDALRSLQAHDKALQELQTAHLHTEALHPPARGSTIDAMTPIFPSSYAPSLPSTWWFSHKKDVDSLLHEDDQAETAEEEGDKIRKRCQYLPPLSLETKDH